MSKNPHLRILPVTSAYFLRKIYTQFTRCNIHILPLALVCDITTANWILVSENWTYLKQWFRVSKAKAKQRCIMGVGMYLYAQLVQTKNT